MMRRALIARAAEIYTPGKGHISRLNKNEIKKIIILDFTGAKKKFRLNGGYLINFNVQYKSAVKVMKFPGME